MKPRPPKTSNKTGNKYQGLIPFFFVCPWDVQTGCGGLVPSVFDWSELPQELQILYPSGTCFPHERQFNQTTSDPARKPLIEFYRDKHLCLYWFVSRHRLRTLDTSTQLSVLFGLLCASLILFSGLCRQVAGLSWRKLQTDCLFASQYCL